MKLLLTFIALTSLLYVVQTCEAARGTLVYVSTPCQAETPYNSDWCDIMYSELHFKEVPSTIYSECSSRFQWNINRDKTSMRKYAQRLNTSTF